VLHNAEALKSCVLRQQIQRGVPANASLFCFRKTFFPRPGCKGFRTIEAMVERDLRGRCPNGGWAVLLALEARRNGISGECAGIGICRAA